MSTDLAVMPEQRNEVSVQSVLDRLGSIQDLMRRAMVKDIDFGAIPGTGGKPTLLKPGAEKLCLMFRFAPEYNTVKHFDGGHLTVESECRILSSEGSFPGSANSIASTREAKYSYRKAERICPKCAKAAIIKGREEYGGGWVCFKKKDGCGAKFNDNDEQITSQQAGRVENTDLADSYNTVLRIAEKRAYIAAVRLVTGSSALFDEEHGQYEAPEPSEAGAQPVPSSPNQPVPPAPAKPKPAAEAPKMPVLDMLDWRKRVKERVEQAERDKRSILLTDAALEVKNDAPQGSKREMGTYLSELARAEGLAWDKTINMYVKMSQLPY